MTPLDQLIVALDVPSRTQAMALVGKLDGSVRWVKVGLELYLAEGRGIVEELVSRDLKVFLDLKLHDIPNTVAHAVHSVANTGASLLTVHASGGPDMLAAAVEAAPSTLRLLAVTVLTSMDQAGLNATGVSSTVEAQVVRLGEMAVAAGVHGLVCSARESAALRSSTARHAHLVVPGIRPASYAMSDDQRRTSTAAEAIALGANTLVVGRPVTRAADPAAAARALLAEITDAKGH